MARVKLVNVVKKFGKVIAVNNVSLEIRDKEFFALLGPSGSGKTTLLRLIAGLETPDSGEIYIDDKLVNYVHPKNRDIAMVFQNYALYPHMTVYENIAFPLMARRKELGLSKDEIKKRVLEIAKKLEIEHLLDRYPSQLSGGQQQRVALARALVRKPKVWLLDEPLSNLDAKLRLLMRAELKKLQKELGVTTIYVTHDQVEALSMADRIAVLMEGKVQQVGTPEELYYKPSNTFVATFIGTPPMNLIKCEFKEHLPLEAIRGIGIKQPTKTRYSLKCPGLTIPLAEEIAKKLINTLTSNDVILGIRPHFFKPVTTAEKTSEPIIKINVIVVEPLGSEKIVTGRIDDTIIRVKLPEDMKVKMGDELLLSINIDKILIFDSKTGKLLI